MIESAPNTSRRTSWFGVMRGGGRLAGHRLRGSQNLRLHALLTVLLLALGVLVVPVAASAAPGDVGVEGPSHSGTGITDRHKAGDECVVVQRRVLVGEPVGHRQLGFPYLPVQCRDDSWVDTGVATETRANTHHDVLWDGTTLYVASYRFVNDGLRLSRVSRRRCGVTATTRVQKRTLCWVLHRSTTTVLRR